MIASKVLIVDDDPVILRVTAALLEKAGWEVQTHDRALGTTTMVDTFKPDVMLLDIEMPALSAEQLGPILQRRSRHDVAIVLYSGAPTDRVSKVTKEIGAIGSIPKSTTGKELVRQLGDLMRAHSGGA